MTKDKQATNDTEAMLRRLAMTLGYRLEKSPQNCVPSGTGYLLIDKDGLAVFGSFYDEEFVYGASLDEIEAFLALPKATRDATGNDAPLSTREAAS